MRFASLGSGSRGNATVVACGATTVLVDCGFSLKETRARLGRLGLTGAELTALVVTHEHRDHVAGIGVVARAFGLPVWMTPGTELGAGLAGIGELPAVHRFSSHESFVIGDLEIIPFPVPHDAREPCQFVFSDGRYRLGLLTDTGTRTPHIDASLAGCDALLIECNHDPDMLAAGPYPPRLKERVGGAYGHLDNAAAADIVSGLDTGRLRHLVAMHLSETNNLPHLARGALSRGAGWDADDIKVADQANGLGWCAINCSEAV